jgi:hypothetical protein
LKGVLYLFCRRKFLIIGTQTNSILAPSEADEAWLRDPVRVQHALDQVLSSPPFRNTQQCQNLLRYIVKHTLAGEDHLLRERVIGSEVFGRRPDYEPGEDPVVRLRAAEVRKRLAQFHQSAVEAPEIHIDIPPGCYRATFRRSDAFHAPPHEAEPPPAARPIEPESQPSTFTPDHAADPPAAFSTSGLWNRTRLIGVAIAFILLIAVVVVASTSWEGAQASRFRTFWSPWTTSPKPVIIAIGSNAVYRLSDSMNDQFAKDHHLEMRGEEFFVPLAPDASIRGGDLVPAENSFVALGDVAAVSNMVANLTRQKQNFQERFPNDISFAELRNSPSILVGGFNNPMTMELTRNLRFVLRVRNEIDDLEDANRRWLLHASADSHDTEDYAIITRLIQRPGDAPVLSVAGMGQYGTLAATEFVCSPAAISEMTRRLPKDWANRNLQLVLHVKVVDFKPASTEVIAMHTW